MNNSNRPLLKTHQKLGCALAAASVLFGFSPASLGQGALTPPPGPITPVMKTLEQLEPRRVLNSLPGVSNAVHVITQSGHYYLTANVMAGPGQSGILVAAESVTIDLNGFTVLGSGSGNHDGIAQLDPVDGNASGIIIRNGKVRRWGGAGIRLSNSSIQLLEELEISDCGASGIQASGARLVRKCRVERVRDTGMNFVSDFTTVTGCLVDGVQANVGTATGIKVSSGTVSDCQVRYVNGPNATGIFAYSDDADVRDCSVREVAAGSGSAVGIQSVSVERSFLDSIESASGNATGILARRIKNCSVTDVMANSGTAVACQPTATGTVLHDTEMRGVSGHAAYGVYASTNAVHILNSTVSHVTGKGGVSHGIVGQYMTVIGTEVSSVTNSGPHADGIVAYGGTIERSSVSRVKRSGISINGVTTVLNCRVDRAGLSGITVSGQHNRIEGNHVTGSGFGINLISGAHVTMRNFAGGNGTNYVNLPSGHMVNTYGAMTTATSPFMNVGL
jgi:hypothetical protein